MRDYAVANNVTSIDMPKIGCGLDKMAWSKVRSILEEAFKYTNISVQ